MKQITNSKFNADQFMKRFNEHLSKASSIESVTPVTLVTPKNDNIQDYIIEQLEERVAIIEYDGQIPNDWALPIAKIQLRAKPESISKEKWQIIISNLETSPFYLNDKILHQ